MNKKRITNIFILTLLLIIGAMFVSGGPSNLTISTPVNGTYVSGTLTVNFTFLGQVNFSAYNVTIYNSTSTTLIEHNSTWPNNSYVQVTFDTTSLGDMSGYTINVSVNDSSGLHLGNISHYLNILIDNTNPNSTIVLTGTKAKAADQTLTSTGEIDYGTEAVIDCGFSDNLSGLNTSRGSIEVKYPGLSSFSNISASQTTRTNNTLKATLLSGDTNILGGFTIKCILVDKAGNAFTRHFNLTTITVVEGGGAFGIKGFEAPVGKVKISSGTVSDGGRLTTDGESRLMKENGAITFDVNGEMHKIEVKSASESEVTLTISSEPMEVTIAAGESELVDLNGDGEADMELTYHKLFAGGYADLTFTLVSESIEMPEEEKEEVLEEVEVPEKVAEPVGGLTVTLAVIVIILIIGYALIKGKKK